MLGMSKTNGELGKLQRVLPAHRPAAAFMKQNDTKLRGWGLLLGSSTGGADGIESSHRASKGLQTITEEAVKLGLPKKPSKSPIPC
mmetsp:Transcript_44073/g.65374  ORF Transcript_44073/g.65374 Transcript_44073/m.65374 type:complete len:86 (-) Transcript_44073:31-288(-)